MPAAFLGLTSLRATRAAMHRGSRSEHSRSTPFYACGVSRYAVKKTQKVILNLFQHLILRFSVSKFQWLRRLMGFARFCV